MFFIQNLHKADAACFLSAESGQEDARLNCYNFISHRQARFLPKESVETGQHLSMKIKTADILEKFLPAVHHEYTLVNLPWEE